MEDAFRYSHDAMDTGMGLAVPMRPHALLVGVCDMHQQMRSVLASAVWSLDKAVAESDAVRAVFSSLHERLWDIDNLMHKFFKDTQGGQLAQVGVLEHVVEEHARARVAGWLQPGGDFMPSILQAKHELQHASCHVHESMVAYNEHCFRLNGLTDAFWRACYDQVCCATRHALYHALDTPCQVLFRAHVASRRCAYRSLDTLSEVSFWVGTASR
jgi:hypothetical protein